MSKQAKLIARLIPLESFELIGIYLKKCVQKGLKKCDYTIYMDMNIATLPKKGLKTRPYNIDMEKRDLKTRPHSKDMNERDLKTRPYSKDMEKKDLKKLTKGQLIKLLMNQ